MKQVNKASREIPMWRNRDTTSQQALKKKKKSVVIYTIIRRGECCGRWWTINNKGKFGDLERTFPTLETWLPRMNIYSMEVMIEVMM